MNSINLPEPHWLPAVRQVPSPNYNQRPVDTKISLLVIHNISLPAGEFGSDCVEQLFTNCLDCSERDDFASLQGLEVSAHLFIDRLGRVTQFVPLNYRAWHAGESCFEGRSGCNDFSIGIELEGTDECPYTEHQYKSLRQMTRQIIKAYPAIIRRNIVGHSDIAPMRKTDPGPAFNWDYFFNQL
ncbi:1,6-anhydro-N-acetylmuramyl-L-alanine amidase AmpD [Oceanicoccus sp. KOV_DT_Chl]|uniref:1,6-anhydro-N-acetylmuramyl-L-alanine amidase AmpD n=1 Tax=Oceanicoccus sp. KOV_DT_Chl TaxID=1904639 RepID=UPI001F2F1F11|nr:1,6-anhydro-N-acetylmuramyl-L-alanine amidase AmpD [Oceanicoccus sp. KOV_DT_Chl]